MKEMCIRDRIHVIQIVLLGVVGLDGAILLNKGINEALGEVQILLVAGGLVQAQAGRDHAAVDVVPLVGFAAAHLFNVPHGLSLIHISRKGAAQLCDHRRSGRLSDRERGVNSG